MGDKVSNKDAVLQISRICVQYYWVYKKEKNYEYYEKLYVNKLDTKIKWTIS